MKRKVTASFDELIRHRYGDTGGTGTRFALRLDDLFASYYGIPSAPPRRGQTPTSVVLSYHYDDGETLAPRRRRDRIGRPEGRLTSAAPLGERPASRGTEPVPAALDLQRGAPEEGTAAEEYRVDVLEPPGDRAPVTPPPPRSALQSLSATGDTGASGTPDDDFVADMKSILAGKKVFDPVTKQTVEQRQSPAPPPAAPPVPEAQNEQAIFDRIAQSMQYANAYNLGTIELANRFADFDAMADLQAKAPPARQAASGPPAPVTAPPPVGSEEFIRDLDAIRSQRGSPAPHQDYSAPMFEAGEHVRTGGDLYADRLRVGKPPGVLFSYGQIVAMADLYDSVDSMMAADVGELQRLKTLLQRDTTHAASGGAAAVSTGEWNDATRGRYLKLADNNYEHFSPNPLFRHAFFARAPRTKGDNKSAWERHHRRAIEEARKLVLAQPTSTVPFLEWPLIINAFGDHFLTDAFASGHAISKEATIARFTSNFLSGGSLTEKGKVFFENVAKQAFHGEVARRFSALETRDYPVCAFGWCFKWRPNIDSPSMLAKVLIAAAEQQPDRIANVAVKALHDRLNEEGIEVINDAGDGPWTIKGDGFLDARTLPIVRRAVQQSVDNINDPSILASGIDFDGYFARVWKHVPRPTEASLQRLAALTMEFTSPDSDVLVDAAAGIIHAEVDALVRTLVDEGKLKAA